MKKLAIIGNGTYAKMMNMYIDMTGFGQVLFYVADKEYIYESKLEQMLFRLKNYMRGFRQKK